MPANRSKRMVCLRLTEEQNASLSAAAKATQTSRTYILDLALRRLIAKSERSQARALSQSAPRTTTLPLVFVCLYIEFDVDDQLKVLAKKHKTTVTRLARAALTEDDIERVTRTA